MSKFSAEHVRKLLRNDLDIYVEITQKRIDDYQRLAAKMESLYEYASSLELSGSSRSTEIIRLITKLLPQWKEMTLLAMYGNFEGALEVFDDISSQVDAVGLETPAEATATPPCSEDVPQPELSAPIESAPPEPDAPSPAPSVVQGRRPSRSAAGFARRAIRPQLKIAGQKPRRNAHEIATAELETMASDETQAQAAPAEMDSAIQSTDGAAVGEDTELAEVFKEEVAGYLDELSANLASLRVNEKEPATWGTIRRLCHTIKGSAAMLGMDEASAKARAAEQLARTAECELTQRTSFRVKCVAKIVLDIAGLFKIPFGVVNDVPC